MAARKPANGVVPKCLPLAVGIILTSGAAGAIPIPPDQVQRPVEPTLTAQDEVGEMLLPMQVLIGLYHQSAN